MHPGEPANPLRLSPSVSFTMELHLSLWHQALINGIIRQAASDLTLERGGPGWLRSSLSPQSRHCFSILQRAATRTSPTPRQEPGKQKEQPRTVQGNQYLSRNIQASCQLSSNPDLALLRCRGGWHVQEQPGGMRSWQVWLALEQTLRGDNLHWSLCKYLKMKSKPTATESIHPP